LTPGIKQSETFRKEKKLRQIQITRIGSLTLYNIANLLCVFYHLFVGVQARHPVLLSYVKQKRDVSFRQSTNGSISPSECKKGKDHFGSLLVGTLTRNLQRHRHPRCPRNLRCLRGETCLLLFWFTRGRWNNTRAINNEPPRFSEVSAFINIFRRSLLLSCTACASSQVLIFLALLTLLSTNWEVDIMAYP
jgi:hypothetical protein